MASKNNPEMRGRKTEKRKYDGKEVTPVLYINGASRFIAGMFDSGDFATDAQGNVIPHKNI